MEPLLTDDRVVLLEPSVLNRDMPIYACFHIEGRCQDTYYHSSGADCSLCTRMLVRYGRPINSMAYGVHAQLSYLYVT